MVEYNETMLGDLNEEETVMTDEELFDADEPECDDADAMDVKAHFEHIDAKGERVKRILATRRKKVYKRGKHGKTTGVEMRKCELVELFRKDPDAYMRMVRAGKLTPPIRQYADRDMRVYSKQCKAEIGREARVKYKRDAVAQLGEYFIDRTESEEETKRTSKEMDDCFEEAKVCQHLETGFSMSNLELEPDWFFPYFAIFYRARDFFPKISDLFTPNIDKWDLYNFIEKLDDAIKNNDNDYQKSVLVVIRAILQDIVGIIE